MTAPIGDHERAVVAKVIDGLFDSDKAELIDHSIVAISHADLSALFLEAYEWGYNAGYTDGEQSAYDDY